MSLIHHTRALPAVTIKPVLAASHGALWLHSALVDGPVGPVSTRFTRPNAEHVFALFRDIKAPFRDMFAVKKKKKNSHIFLSLRKERCSLKSLHVCST